MATLIRTGRILAFGDNPSNRNPSKRFADWQQDIQGYPVTNPLTEEFKVAPGAEITLFSGIRTLTANGSTNYALSLSTLDPSRYRLTWAGAGTDPTFRTARSVAVAATTLTLTLLANQTLTVTCSAGAVFGAVVVGDIVTIPGVATGDTALFDPLNEGDWIVMAATSTTLTLKRDAGTVFSGASEAQAVASNSEFFVYSADGVQVDDILDITAGFTSDTLRSYRVLSVTSKWVEFVSSLPLAAQTVVPGASGIAFYSSAKRFVYLEADQEIAVKFNGNTGENDRIEPMVAGTESGRGWAEKFGTAYSLVVKNRSTTRATVVLISAE